MASETTTSIEFLSQLLLSDDRSQAFPASELEECLRLAHKHHVVVRWLQLLPETSVGQDPKVAEWAKNRSDAGTSPHRKCAALSGNDLH